MITISKYSADLYVHLLTSIIKYLKFFKHSRTTYKSTSLWIECCRRWIAWLKAWPFLRARASQFHCVVWGSGVLVWLKRFLHAAKGQETRVHMFSPFSLFAFLFSFLHCHTCMFFLFPQRVPIDLEVGGGKSILTRTKTLPTSNCFKEPLLFITLCIMRMCFHLLFIAIRTWK